MSELPNLFGIPIRTTDLDLHTIEPVRKHKRSRHQTDAYHKRIQKKRNKRYGTVKVPYAVLIDPAATHLYMLGGKQFIVSKRGAAVLRGFAP